MARTIALCGLWCGCRLIRVPAIRLCGLRYRQGVSASRGVSWINTRVLERLIQGLFTNSIGLPPEANIHKEKGQITPAETKQPQRTKSENVATECANSSKNRAISLAKSRVGNVNHVNEGDGDGVHVGGVRADLEAQSVGRFGVAPAQRCAPRSARPPRADPANQGGHQP